MLVEASGGNDEEKVLSGFLDESKGIFLKDYEFVHFYCKINNANMVKCCRICGFREQHTFVPSMAICQTK